MVNYRTVSLKGMGAAINFNASSHQISNTFSDQFVADLRGDLEAKAERGGLEIQLALGSGKSENWGMSGSLSMSFSAQDQASNTVSNQIADSATIKAASLAMAAIEGGLSAVRDPNRPFNSKSTPIYKSYGYLNLDVAGDVLNSNSIGIGTAFIINDIERQAVNQLGAIDANSSIDSIRLDALTSGEISGVAVAGSISSDTRLTNNQGDKSKPKFNDDVGLSQQYSDLYQGLLSRGFPIDGSASVAVQNPRW